MLRLIILTSFLINSVYSQGESCYTPNNFIGICQSLPNCPSLIQLYQSDRSRNAVNFLVASQRSCGNRVIRRNPILCCTDDVEQDTPAPPPPPPVVITTTTTTTTTTTPPPPTQPPPAPPTLSPKRQADCLGPDNVEGYCTSIRLCPTVLDTFLKKQQDPDYVRYIKESNAICNYVQPNICCPLDTPATTTTVITSRPTPAPTSVPVTGSGKSNLAPRLLTPETGCGWSNVTHTRIVGGQAADIHGWPWMALIGYTNTLGEVSFKCGGSVITTKHVLTAAHCMRGDLTSVRLGEHDTSTDAEAQTVDIAVSKYRMHPEYDKKDGHNDISILFLEKEIAFNDAIRPICLPLTDPLRSRNLVGFTPFVAGWGRTQEGGKSATVLQELQIPVLNNQDCLERYQKIGKLLSDKQFDNAVICAGVLAGGQDSCQGDSGGPLMSPQRGFDQEFYYYQIGIVSYGIGCARADVPGVYTRVSNFVDWIEKEIDAS